LNLSRGSEKQVFPALKQLSLSAVSFEHAQMEMAHAFSLSSLGSLKLCFCPGWEDLLRHITSSHQQIRLRSLEIQSDLDYNDGDEEASTISAFLQIFEGLQELFISTSAPSETLCIWRSMLHHKSTLRRFVHHQRSVNLDETSPNYEERCDLPDLSFVSKDIKKLIKDPSQNPFSDLDLECIGLCCIPKFLIYLTPEF